MLYSLTCNPSTSYLVRYGRTMTNVPRRDNLPINCDHFTLVPSMYVSDGIFYDDILPSVFLMLFVSPLTECLMFGFVSS